MTTRALLLFFLFFSLLAASLAGGIQGEQAEKRWMGKKNLHYHTWPSDEPDYDANNPIVRGGQPVVETEYLTGALTREAVDFIDRHDDKPFLLYLAYNAVHSPLQGVDAYMKKSPTLKTFIGGSGSWEALSNSEHDYWLVGPETCDLRVGLAKKFGHDTTESGHSLLKHLSSAMSSDE